MTIKIRNLENEIPKYLDMIVNNLKENFHSRLLLIFLFGSRATDNSTTRSDIDILVVIKGLEKPKPLSPPRNIRLDVDILAIPCDEFEEGIKVGKGLFIEVMVYGRSLYGEETMLTYFQELAKTAIKKYSMERTDIGWKKEI
ncbi:MAG: nucleotidyltransferase domain-containing protein [Candidatus Kariarchaeaceae archaeon]